VVHINQPTRCDGCLRGRVSTGHPWKRIVLDISGDVRPASGLVMFNSHQQVCCTQL
jgi:hypothetical protein